jgi:hypothetical protein
MTHSQDFTYYSFDFREMIVTQNYLPPFKYNSQAMFSLDICTVCCDSIKDHIRKNYKAPHLGPNRHAPKGIHCDLTGTHLKGNYTFYNVAVAKVDVQMTGKAVTCSQCGTIAKDIKAQCTKCGGVTYKRSADTVTDDRHFELWVCEDEYKAMKAKYETLMKNPEAAEWSS